MKSVASLLLLFVAAHAATTNDVNRPVNKVITLLKEMQAQLEAEQKQDEEIYDKLACWCETNEKSKSKAIEEAEERISQLTSQIEETSATMSRLKQEIANLAKEIAANEDSLAKATEIRGKEHEEFAAEEKDLMSSIASLKAAVVVLSKHHSAPKEALLHISQMIRHMTTTHSDLLGHHMVARAQKSVVLLQGDFFGSTPSFKNAYAPQSGEIFGILENMLESFQANLDASRKEEAEAQAAFEALKSAKEDEIAAGKEQADQKTSELAKQQEDFAEARQDLKDTQASLAADQEFLVDLKEKCSQTDDEWSQRQKTRQEEMRAVSQALSVLTSDDAHDLFVRTFNPGFAQKKLSEDGSRRRKVEDILSAAAKKFQNAAFIQLASSARLDSFERVKQAIDQMVVQLKKESADEIKHRDWCVHERSENDHSVEVSERDKSDIEALIESLEQKIEAIAKEIVVLEAQIKDAQIQIKRAGEDREAENKEFQTTVTDQRATQAVLSKALQVLQAFYNKALLQEESDAQHAALMGQAPPPGFNGDYQKKSSGANGVMALIQTIMGEAAEMEKEAVQAERDAQSAYESFVKDTNAQIGADQKDITNKAESKAKAEQDHTQASEDLAGKMTELEQLAKMSAELHSACDYLIKNFDVRQTARAQEIEALGQAKAILSGASFSGASFLARH